MPTWEKLFKTKTVFLTLQAYQFTARQNFILAACLKFEIERCSD